MRSSILQLAAAAAIAVFLHGCDQQPARQQQQPPPATETAANSTASGVPAAPSAPLVSNMEIALTIDCQPLGSEAPSPESLPELATVIVLATSDGRLLRFQTERHSKPQLQSDGSGGYT